MIRLTAIEKAFSGQTVLSGIDLQLQAGSVTALIGPSGAWRTSSRRSRPGASAIRPRRGS